MNGGGVVLVTGAAYGIGLAVTERLVADGRGVCTLDAVADADALEALEALAGRLGPAVAPVAGDVREDGALAAAAAAMAGAAAAAGW